MEEIELGIDRNTVLKLKELEQVYGYSCLTEVVNLAFIIYDFYIQQTAQEWVLVKVVEEGSPCISLERNYRELALFASAECHVTIRSSLEESHPSSLCQRLARSGAADHSAMVIEAVWILADVTDVIKEGEAVGMFHAGRSEYAPIAWPAFSRIKKKA